MARFSSPYRTTNVCGNHSKVGTGKYYPFFRLPVQVIPMWRVLGSRSDITFLPKPAGRTNHNGGKAKFRQRWIPVPDFWVIGR